MIKFISAFILVLTLPGCDSNDTSADAVGQNPGSTPVGAGSTPGAVTPATSLSAAPVDYQAALGRVPATVTLPGPCPFLSDDTVEAAVNSDFELKRQLVSNTECRWAYNAGFTIDVTVKPIDQSIPVDQRRYNLGVDTVLEPQTGPGKNAVLVSDTAFGRPIPFGYGFELDDDVVFIQVTGLKIDNAGLRNAADEIAGLLPDAPAIQPQSKSESITFEPCSIWQNEAIESVLQLAEDDAIDSHASGNSCIYKSYGGSSGKGTTLTVRIGELDPTYHAKALDRGHEDVKGFDFPVSANIEESDFGTYTKIVGYVGGGAIEIFLLDEAGVEHKDMTELLLQNLADRIQY